MDSQSAEETRLFILAVRGTLNTEATSVAGTRCHVENSTALFFFFLAAPGALGSSAQHCCLYHVRSMKPERPTRAAGSQTSAASNARHLVSASSLGQQVQAMRTRAENLSGKHQTM